MLLTMTISVAVIAAIMVVGILFCIPVLLRVKHAAREAEKVLETVRMQIVPLSHDLTLISQEVNGILQSVHRQVERMEDSINTVRDTAERLREFEEDILHRFEVPLVKIATIAGAISRGLETFFLVLRR